MSRRTWNRIASAAALVFVVLPFAWVASRPAAEVGDAGAVEQQLRAAARGPVVGSLGATGSLDTPAENSLPGVAADDPSPAVENNARPLVLEPAPGPVRLEIAAIAVDAPVTPHGVDRRGQMAVPYNVTEVGWYRYGPSPGEAGSAVLAAHVDLAGRGKGVFFDLRRLEPGDVVTIGYDDGSTRDFAVVARVDYDKQELPLDVIFAREGAPVLTLVTCGGAFNSSIGHYDSNVVVYATPLAEGVHPGSAA